MSTSFSRTKSGTGGTTLKPSDLQMGLGVLFWRNELWYDEAIAIESSCFLILKNVPSFLC